MVSLNVPENLWKEFLKQSIDLRRSASERIKEFIEKELEKDKKEVGKNENKL